MIPAVFSVGRSILIAQKGERGGGRGRGQELATVCVSFPPFVRWSSHSKVFLSFLVVLIKLLRLVGLVREEEEVRGGGNFSRLPFFGGSLWSVFLVVFSQTLLK